MKSELDILLELNDLVIREIGLELDSQYNIIDQDTGSQLQINGKLIKYYFGTELKQGDPGYYNNNDKIFDCVHDPYLMNFLVSYYIEKIKQEEPDLYIYSYHPVLDKITNRSALEFKGNFNAITRFYSNECLKFIEGLFLLSGDSLDLSEYDKLLSIYEPKETKRR